MNRLPSVSPAAAASPRAPAACAGYALSVLAIVALLVAAPMPAVAAPAAEASLTIRDHRFEPAELKVPAGAKVKLLVSNEDATPEEFESHALNREKVIAGKAKATIWVGPLQPGRYDFVGEFHEKTAKGVLIAE